MMYKYGLMLVPVSYSVPNSHSEWWLINLFSQPLTSLEVDGYVHVALPGYILIACVCICLIDSAGFNIGANK